MWLQEKASAALGHSPSCHLRGLMLAWPLGFRDLGTPHTSSDLDYQERLISHTQGLLFRNPTKVFCIKRVCVCVCACTRARVHMHPYAFSPTLKCSMWAILVCTHNHHTSLFASESSLNAPGCSWSAAELGSGEVQGGDSQKPPERGCVKWAPTNKWLSERML